MPKKPKYFLTNITKIIRKIQIIESNNFGYKFHDSVILPIVVKSQKSFKIALL